MSNTIERLERKCMAHRRMMLSRHWAYDYNAAMADWEKLQAEKMREADKSCMENCKSLVGMFFGPDATKKFGGNNDAG